MLRRSLLAAGWLLPPVLALLFALKGRHYDEGFYLPPAAAASALPVPGALGAWTLEGGDVLPADRMFEKIDGKADYYLQYGAVELCSGEWVADGQRWDMYLYRFKEAQGARGAYNGERPADGKPLEGIEGYAVPGQAAVSAGCFYLQLNAQTAEADPAPAVELARTLASLLGGVAGDEVPDAAVDLAVLAGDAAAGTEEYLPENAFGFSVFAGVRSIRVRLGPGEAVWFTCPGDAATVAAYAEELAAFGGEECFDEDGMAGGAMFGSWSLAGVMEGAVWGVQEAATRDALSAHWSALRERLETREESP